VNQPSARCAFLIEYLDLQEASGDPDARWQEFQLRNLNNSSTLTIDAKGRQVGWSWTAAADAVAESCLVPRTTNIFVSINQDEAKEKVRYAREIIASLDREVRPKLLHDNELYVELANGSRLISHPCRPVRGKAKARVFLDEFAHYPKDREIYTSALPATTRGGSLHIGSSPLGASGQFWEIYAQQIQKYPGFKRALIPWYLVGGLSKDPKLAKLVAPEMTTEERVRQFGTERLVTIFENLLLEDFQQEYECTWVDEATAWISWEEIKRNQVDAQAGEFWNRTVLGVDAALRAIEEVADAMREGKIELALAGGMDIGRKHNLTELAFVGKPMGSQQRPLRLAIGLANVEYDDQIAVAVRALEVLPVTQLLIDQNGLGNQLAESLHKRYGDRAQGVDFTNESKELWAVELKLQMQRGRVPLPLDRGLTYQLHSVKKKTTTAKNAVFDTAANEKHHADKFWALALAVWAGKTDLATQTYVRKHR
jgi:phage FluMu gp28-like protein